MKCKKCKTEKKGDLVFYTDSITFDNYICLYCHNFTLVMKNKILNEE